MSATTDLVRAVAIALGLGLCGLVSCSDDVGPPPLPAAPNPPPAKAEPPPPPRPAYVVPKRHGEVLAHIRLADTAALLAKLEGMVPAGIADALSVPALRRRLSRGTPPSSTAFIGHVEPGPPAGCVLLDPSTRDVPVACVFGYEGGLEQLALDLGPEGVVADEAAGLHVRRDGEAWFFDALGDHIVFGRQPDAFEVSRTYLEQLTYVGGARDIEIVVHTAHAAKAYREELSALIVAASVAAEGSSGAAEGARAAWSGLPPEVTELALDALDELAGLAAQAQRVELYATVAPTRLALGLTAIPSAGTGVSRWLGASMAIEPTVWDWLPNGTWLTWASRRHPQGTLRPQWRALSWRVVAHYLSRFIERETADVQAVADAWSLARDKMYGDWSLVAAFNSPATIGGAMLVRPRTPGVDARETWLQLAEAATPQALFGDALGRTVEGTVRWRVERAAATVEGLTVDEWRLSAAPGLLERLDESLEAGSLGKDIVGALSERESLLAIQRFELAGAVVFTLAPGGSESYARKVVRAKHGEGRASRNGVDSIARGRGRVGTLAAFSGFDLVRSIREMVPADVRADLPQSVGQDLSDAHYTEAVSEDGAATYELVISTFVLEALRDALRTTGADPDPAP